MDYLLWIALSLVLSMWMLPSDGCRKIEDERLKMVVTDVLASERKIQEDCDNLCQQGGVGWRGIAAEIEPGLGLVCYCAPSVRVFQPEVEEQPTGTLRPNDESGS